MTSEPIEPRQPISASAGADAESNTAGEYWCNFCGFKSSDLQKYLGHSCRDVLAAAGVAVTPTGSNECR